MIGQNYTKPIIGILGIEVDSIHCQKDLRLDISSPPSALHIVFIFVIEKKNLSVL